MNNLVLTKKDIIALNQRFDKGHFNNESSLDYALVQFKRDIRWTKQLAYLIRAILIDHVFEEANKRTTLAALIAYIELRGYKLDDKKGISMIKSIILKNITSIKKISEMIENAIFKQIH
jgi:prophage maintenance system killer protein